MMLNVIISANSLLEMNLPVWSIWESTCSTRRKMRRSAPAKPIAPRREKSVWSSGMFERGPATEARLPPLWSISHLTSPSISIVVTMMTTRRWPRPGKPKRPLGVSLLPLWGEMFFDGLSLPRLTAGANFPSETSAKEAFHRSPRVRV